MSEITPPPLIVQDAPDPRSAARAASKASALPVLFSYASSVGDATTQPWVWTFAAGAVFGGALALAAAAVASSSGAPPPRSLLTAAGASAGAALTLALLSRALSPGEARSVGGSITLVGAGPGAPELMTLAAHAALQRADLVICDLIAPPGLRAIAPRHAQFRLAGKLPGVADAAQDELNAWGLDALRRGKNVVRLKVGDPFLYGRGGEEVVFYSAHGFVPRVIPGVCAALAAPLAAGIPVTHRGCAASVLVSTGHGRGGTFPDVPPYDATRTLVLLMAVARAPALHADLCGERGYPPATPVAVIERASHPDQRVTRTTLEGLALAAERVRFQSPAVVVVGAVVGALEREVAEALAQNAASSTGL